MLKQKHLALLLLIPSLTYAGSWQNLWLNKDQQAQLLLKQGKNQEAANLFSNPNWKGIAYYRNKDYDKAYLEFKKDTSAQGLYNQGNALAYMQKYQEAIDSYKKALEKDKTYPDTEHNIQVLEKLLKQQKQDKDKQQDQKNQQPNKNQTDKNKNDKSQFNKDKNNSEDKSQNQNQKNGNSQKDNEKKVNPNQPQDQNKGQKNNQDNTNSSQQNNQKDQKQQMADNPRNPNNNQQQKNADNQAKQDAVKNTNDLNKKDSATAYAETDKKPSPEDKHVQAVLSQIPDDPDGLLRNKFLRDYQYEQQGNQQ